MKDGSPAIGPMHEGDEMEIIALWERCGLTRPWNDAANDIAFARRQENADVLVYRQGDVIVGTAMVGQDGHRGVAYYVAVAPEFRKTGLGRSIMRAAEDWCRARGLWKLNILVRDDNAGAIGFYESLGYSPGGTTQLGKMIGPDKKPD